jgi:methylmalonyl-CoA/ethylmalonyl-CoA epimerase
MAPPLRLHHVGFVVANIETAMPGFLRSLAAEWDGQIFHDPLQKVRVAFLATRSLDPLIELVEPAGDDSPVLRFLKERGGGLHHVCYEVADLEEELAAFRSRGALIAKRPLPAVAFGGRRIAWVITSEKLLVELLEESVREKR